MSETPSIGYGNGARLLDYRGRTKAAWISEGRWSHRFQPLTKRVCALCIGTPGASQHHA